MVGVIDSGPKREAGERETEMEGSGEGGGGGATWKDGAKWAVLTRRQACHVGVAPSVGRMGDK